MKRISILLTLCLFLLSVPDTLNAETMYYQQNGQNAKAEAQIRAAYWGIKPIEQAQEQLRVLKAHGFNTALLADGAYQLKEELWRMWGEIAAKHGIHLFPVFNFAVPGDLKPLQEKYRTYVDRFGNVYPATPCPLENNYWNTVIGQRFEQFAHLSKMTHIMGIAFDTEMYGSDFSIYNADPCFCDFCWREFIRAEGSVNPDVKHEGGSEKVDIQQDAHHLSKEHRFDYLIQHQLFQQYTTFQTQRVQDILSHIEKRVHSIDPHLLFGFLGYRDNWFYAGLIRGLGTATNPVMVFSETTYVRGYTPYVEQEKRSIEKNAEGNGRAGFRPRRSFVRYIPGLWSARFFPEDLASQLYALATSTDGYWMYTAEGLWNPESKVNDHALHGSIDEYWSALKMANDELQQFSHAPDAYQSALAPVPHLSSFYDISQNHLITPPLLQDFLRHAFVTPRLRESHAQNASEIIYRDTTLFHFLNKAGGVITITPVPKGKYPDYIWYRLFDGDGQILQEGIADVHEDPTRILLPANLSGLVSLLTNAGANAARISFSGLPFLIEASSTFPLTTLNTVQTYKMFLRQEKTQVKLRAYCPKDTSTSLTIRSPDNTVNQKTEIVGFSEIRIPVTALQDGGEYWTITTTPLPSTPHAPLRLYFYDEELPYLIPD